MTTTAHLNSAAALRAGVACLLLLTGTALSLRAAADANPPDFMTYQGYLVDANGTPLATNAPKNFDVVLRIFDDQSGGNRLWTEQQTVTVDKGYFSVLLGEGAAVGSEARPALSSLFANDTASHRFIETTVKGIGSGGSDSTIAPRLRLLTSPYAFLAKKAVSAVSLMNDTNRQVVTITGTNLGINTSSPTAALDVNGRARVTGSLTVNGFTNSGVSSLSGDVIAADKLTAGRIYATNQLHFSAAGDAYLTVKNIQGGMNPVINFAGDDWLSYKRAENQYSFNIGTAEMLRISSSNVVVSATNGISGYGTIPLGGIIMWSGASVPFGWALCDGQTINGVVTPDLRGRFVLASGAGSGLTSRAIGDKGGKETHALTVEEMPAHSHPTSVGTVGYAAAWNSSREATRAPGEDHNNGWQTFPSANTGGSQAHTNMPPYYVLAFIMRVQ